MTDRTFVKRRADAPPGFFAVEAAGLSWLAAAGTVAVARPLSVSPTELVLERVRASASSPAAAERFGRDLAALHDAGAPAHGCPPAGWTGDGFIGTLPLPHRDLDGHLLRWGEFFATLRIAPYVRLARDAGTLTAAQTQEFDRVCALLVGGAYDGGAYGGEPPSRLHGDLWNGNVLWSERGAVLIDPAAHGGHRETDLAMLTLFGLPGLDRVVAAYDETHPLAAGWPDRVALHQLHPLLVHTALFGGAYAEQAVRAARTVR